MNYEKIIEVPSPPYKYHSPQGKDYYLSGNVFFMRDQWTKNTIKKKCLEYLEPHFRDVPKLSKLRIRIEVHSYKTQFDLDNKGYFWIKILLDLLKTPTPKQIKNSHLRGREIISANVLEEDTVKFVDYISMRYRHGGDKLVFHIKGQLLDVQQKLL